MSSCPICHVSIPPMMVMCRKDWFKVPAALRDKIWRLYRSAKGSPEHRAAVFQAIQVVREPPAPEKPKQGTLL